MSKKNRNILFTVLGLILFILLFSSGKSKKIDWTPTYNETKTKPLDTKVFYEQLRKITKNFDTKAIHSTFYEYNRYKKNTLENQLFQNTTNKNYIHISNHFSPDQQSYYKWLDFINRGNIAFISTNNFKQALLDTLHLKIKAEKLHTNNDSISLKLSQFNSKQLLKRTNLAPIYFDSIQKAQALGTKIVQKDTLINFITIPFGKGQLFLHTEPEVFSNYQLLASKNTNYVNKLISYMLYQQKEVLDDNNKNEASSKDEQPLILFQNNTKRTILYDSAVKQDPDLTNSPLRYILKHPALKYAWYTTLILLTMFLVFFAKRRQRIIPEITPVKNTSLEFLRTLSNLYIDQKDYHRMSLKKCTYFLDTVKTKYYLNIDKLDVDFCKKLALKSNNNIQEIEELIQLIKQIRESSNTGLETLKKLNDKIEVFYKQK